MKTRTGFVSNSSSCSFCLYGVQLKKEDLMEELNLEDIDDIPIQEPLEEGTKLGYWVGQHEYYVYIGRAWRDINLMETGGDFRENVRSQVTTLLNRSVECNTYEEGWYDG